MPGVRLVTYADDLPPTSALLTALGVAGQPFTYIVATSALERKRSSLAPLHQKAPSRDGSGREEPQLVFHKALRHFIQNTPLLTRAEERVIVQRAAQEVAQNPTLERQIRHDVFAWRDALAELAEQGVDLASGFPTHLQDQLVHPSVGVLLTLLQEKYRDFQWEEGKWPFEEAAYDFLNHYSPTSHVVLEGFTFFTRLQEHFVDTCARQGATVHLVYPYRAEQTYGFAVMRRTYGRYLAQGPAEQLVTPSGPGATDLAVAKQYLFADTLPPPASGDGSVLLRGFGHRHREVASCISAIRELIQDQQVEPERVAIVTRNAARIETLLQEEAELQGLPVRLDIAPRLLLLTPLGRFALALYQVWDAGHLRMDADTFESILASGWLGADVQATTDEFSAVKAQLFARCQTREEWAENLQHLRRLRQQLPVNSRLPAASVRVRTVERWERSIERVERLCERLYSGTGRTIGEHIRLLLSELSLLSPERLLQTEREVLERIQEVLLQLAEATSLEMSTAEFGEIFTSLVQERERPPDEDSGDRPGRIWVTTPEGIDGYEKDFIFYVGVDDRRVPRPYAEPWPFYTSNVDAHQEKERYLFLAVVRAAKLQLHLSYAKADEKAVYRPSVYLDELAAILGSQVQQVPDLVGASTAEAPAPPPLLGRARRDEYDLTEIAHFALCPFRYKLERLDGAARRYHEAWQVRFVAEAVWLDILLRNLEQHGTTAEGSQRVLTMLQVAMERVWSQVRDSFPGLRELDWFIVRRWVNRELDWLAQRHSRFILRVEPGTHASYLVTDGDRVVEVDASPRHQIHVGRIRYPYLSDLMREEWLIPGKASDAVAPATKQVDGIRVFTNLYHAVKWWRETSETAFYSEMHGQGQPAQNPAQQHQFLAQRRLEVAGWIAHLEAGNYPKNPGNHCRFCPVLGDCLGLEP